ncbi:MAG: glycosyltransferase family 2 protein [Cryobacterium sp.]|nr:glycosyltransferase family 2 protein [Cryobacterium sp.]MCO5294609.1 glycosyltransferase [Homoserinimonas sp.]MCW5945022.1 glycosyltransferase family 2 protein [Cryobacterium sp.]
MSIGLPVFNDRDFLTQAIDSLLGQTHRDFELIISDDGSTDGSEAICRDYAARDKRVRYIRQPENLGISRNMQFLLEEAKGDFFMWAGDDDFWHPQFISTLLGALDDSPDAIVAYSPYLFVGEDGSPSKNFAKRAADYSAPTPYRRLAKLMWRFDDGFGYGLFRREQILGVRFPVWKGINRTNPYNNIYPTLCYYLSKGGFVLAGNEPLHFKRIKDRKNVHHKIPYSDSFIRGYIAFLLWKRDVVATSLGEISRADSRWTAVRVAPAMIVRWGIWPSMLRFAALCLKLVRRKISFY